MVHTLQQKTSVAQNFNTASSVINMIGCHGHDRMVVTRPLLLLI
jgi:hypothetical protein